MISIINPQLCFLYNIKINKKIINIIINRQYRLQKVIYNLTNNNKSLLIFIRHQSYSLYNLYYPHYIHMNQPTLNHQNSPDLPQKPIQIHYQSHKNKKNRHIIIDIKNTQYRIIKQVANKLSWKVNSKKQPIHSQNPNIIWTDSYISQQQLNDLLPYQKINHFPSSFQLGNKYYLSKNLSKMKKKFVKQYDFFPQTWLMPDDFQRFKSHQQKVKHTWIFKPSSSSQGKGIIITKNLDIIQQKIRNSKKNHQFVLQKYILNPFLIQNLKFDLRIYVLLKSLCPLKIYMYKQGLARFATNSYQKPQRSNLKNNYIHLTNYAINKKNPNFCINSQNQNQGHKRTYSSILKYLESKGHNIKKLQTDIHMIIVKTISSVQPLLSHLYKTSTPNRENIQYQNCFEILGFDILIDNQLKPHLLEVNHTPSFRTDSKLDYEVKSNLIKDTLILANMTSQSKLKIQQGKSLKCQQKYVLKNSNKSIKKQRLLLNNGYILIYPNIQLNEEYRRYIEYSHLIFDIWTGIVKKNLYKDFHNHTSLDSTVMKKKITNQMKISKTHIDNKIQTHNQQFQIFNNLNINNKIQKPKIDYSLKSSPIQHISKKDEFVETKYSKKEYIAPMQTTTHKKGSIRYKHSESQDCIHNFLQKRNELLKKRIIREVSQRSELKTKKQRQKSRIFTKREYLLRMKQNLRIINSHNQKLRINEISN